MNIGLQTSGATLPLWLKNTNLTEHPALDADIKTDVCVIGAGISGLTIAYRLAKEGKKVIVLEDGRIGSGETGRTTAHLSNALDDRYYEIERVHGIHVAKLAARSHTAAINFIENIIHTENISCDFSRVPGYLFAGKSSSPDDLEKEYTAAQHAGINVSWEKLSFIHAENTGACLVFPQQAQFHPYKYLIGLAQAIVQSGGIIYEKTHASDISENQNICVSTDKGYSIEADDVVIATNVPINNKLVMHAKQTPYRTYVIAASMPSGAVPAALYWDNEEPYHYVRTYQDSDKPDETYLIIGGADHRTGEDIKPDFDPFTQLSEWGKNVFPQMGEVKYHWSGQVIEPVDYLGFIGHNPTDNKHIYIVTGDSGNGMTHGTIAGILITDQIIGRENPWQGIYDPSRKSSLKTFKEFATHNTEALLSYFDHITLPDSTSPDNIQPGCAKIIRRGLKEIAVYCDENGKIYECSAVCSHLQAIVHWNSIEKTWDCPAHGSRFNIKGEVINGPANKKISL